MSEACERIHASVNRLEILNNHLGEFDIPSNGLYIMFERGEHAHRGRRIVRIGTHTGNGNLKQRIQEHYEKENKDRSIFRKNIGLALLNKNNDSFIEQWKLDLTSASSRKKFENVIDYKYLHYIEKEVTKVIRNNFSVVVIREDSKEKRLKIEAGLIASVANCEECRPSNSWFGKYSPKEKIRESGLWQEQKINGPVLRTEEITLFENKIKY